MTRQFWMCVTKNLPEWGMMMRGDITPDELRENYVNGHTNCLNSLGIAGRVAVDAHPANWVKKLGSLSDIDWSRDNPVWDGNLIQGHKMVRTTIGIMLGACVILRQCGIKVPNELGRYEQD